MPRSKSAAEAIGIRTDDETSYEGLENESDAQRWVDDLKGEAPREGGEVVQATVLDGSREAATRAADYVATRGFGEATARIIAYIASHALDTADLNVVIVEQLAQKMLNAQTPDDILDPFGTARGEDMYERPLWVVGCSFLEGEFLESFPWYVALETEDPASGRRIPVTVGGERLVMQAAALDMHNGWPRAVMIHQSDRPTKAGYRPLELRNPA